MKRKTKRITRGIGIILAVWILAGAVFPAMRTEAADNPYAQWISVFDPAYYNVNNAEAAAYANGDINRLWQYFVYVGIPKGEQASAEFNVFIYAKNYPALVQAFGGNMIRYYIHYVTTGKGEGRNARTLNRVTRRHGYSYNWDEYEYDNDDDDDDDYEYEYDDNSDDEEDTGEQDQESGFEPLNVTYHTQQEIAAYIAAHPISGAATTYASVPNTSAPYAAGSLSAASLSDALTALNTLRYIAGIPDNVVLNDGYNAQAQAATLVNAANGSLSHSPSRPNGMSDSLYELGKAGCGHSNLGWGHTNLVNAIMNGWIQDGGSNISIVGHRRWILNPSMNAAGFGQVGEFTAMYCFDNHFGDTPYSAVAWPAQNMPVGYFKSDAGWSISLGKQIDAGTVNVYLEHLNSGATYSFSAASSSGDFYVDNAGYGKPGCIFFPSSGRNGNICGKFLRGACQRKLCGRKCI